MWAAIRRHMSHNTRNYKNPSILRNSLPINGHASCNTRNGDDVTQK